MDKLAMTETIMAAKADKGWSWEEIAAQVGLNPVFVTSACLGQSSMPREYGEKLTAALGLSGEVVEALAVCPMKGTEQAVPTDPLVYRFYEIMQVYGTSVKEIIHEKFGDGIMSAIDFTLDVDRQEDPKGDRVVVTMNGKFLPYKIW
ncbi:cyanate hydratase [Thiohalorhabdus denitrificans]|uniref:Cyanate hydratase n=1 Tax=Thiohalorhabdus denitrificans TaxID=381306 RepID=A0A0P9EN51_9GAMM|nr:cyanase [Thiohalorhabdus denitrificans]KPV39953.1 cyanate hydratase [Thiohalorhabdus denitrificans]SCY09650.1 cyanate lyase [Thiohalorhabdus denitrificans]